MLSSSEVSFARMASSSLGLPRQPESEQAAAIIMMATNRARIP